MEVLKKRKTFPSKLFLALLCAFIAAIGTLPYGFGFAKFLQQCNYRLFLGVGGFFAITSMVANMALGSYSLMNADPHQRLINPYSLVMVSIISALPPAFMCYFGFKNSLPFFINLPVSIVVMVVNAGISYSAIYNFSSDFLKKKTRATSYDVKLMRQIGFFMGVCVSITIYVVTSYGMAHLVEGLRGSPKLGFYVGCVSGILSWIPFVALYSNSTKIVAEQVYTFFTKNLAKIAKIGKFDLVLIIIAIGSGSAFTQIAIDFFDPGKDIPAFFKQETMQFFIYNFIVPCTFLSSAAVNYVALRRLTERFQKK